MVKIIKSHKVEIDEKSLQSTVKEILDDKTLMQAVHQLFYKMCDPYVPFAEGVLSQTAKVTPEYVWWDTVYAHYMYEGLVYGPNYPITEGGEVVGFFSEPGKRKSPTGEMIEYNKKYHPLATMHWDEAMMRDKGEEFFKQVANLIIERATRLNG